MTQENDPKGERKTSCRQVLFIKLVKARCGFRILSTWSSTVSPFSARRRDLPTERTASKPPTLPLPSLSRPLPASAATVPRFDPRKRRGCGAAATSAAFQPAKKVVDVPMPLPIDVVLVVVVLWRLRRRKWERNTRFRPHEIR